MMTAFKRAARNERGNVAMIAALAILPILMIAGFAIDFQLTMTQKARVQSTIDSAVLAATKSLEQGRSKEEVTEEVNAYFRAVLNRSENSSLSCGLLNLVFDDAEYEIHAGVGCSNETTLAKIAGHDHLDFKVNSSATYGMGSIEVALVLDTTGSMSGSRIVALKAAAKDFIDIVIKDEQDPFYSKAAIIPYAVAVNAGPYADQARGPIAPGRSISAAVWQDGAQKSISGITRANPAVVTSNSHGFQNGDRVWISGVSGMTQVNSNVYTVSNRTTDTFSLQGVSSSGWTAYSSGGVIRKCLETNCEVRVTSNNHGFSNNEHIVIQGVNGMTQINTGNNVTWRVMNVTQHTYVLRDSVGPNYSTYNHSGTAFCTTEGCAFYRFLNRSANAQRVHPVSTCVTERIGPHAWNDIAPSVSYVGANYPSTGNPCSAVSTVMPLSSDKTALKNKIDAMTIGGSTAGHLGHAWGWYMISPNFGYMFPPESRPADYNTPRLYKFAILMTDGEYNSAYCNNVLAGDSGTGSGSNNDKINCNATNGQSFAQAVNYCREMKKLNIIVYMIGFEVGSSTSVNQMLNDCATGPSYVYLASGAEELREVFTRIALSINDIRLTK